MLARADATRHAPGHARELRRVQDADGGDQRRQIAADKGQHHQRDENLGQGHEHVHHADGGGLGAATQEGHAHADGHAQHAGQRDGGGRHRQRHARAMHGARQQVAAQLVGAQPMLPGGRGQQIGRIDLVRILQAQHGTEGGGQRHQQQEGRRQPGRQRGGQKRGGRRTAASTETGRALMPAACGCGDRPAPGPGRWPG